MANVIIPRLCGGTFFCLVLQAIRQRVKAREHYKGERDGLSDPEVLIGLLKVINPDYQIPTGGPEALKGKTNDFKSCKTSKGQYLPLGRSVEVEEEDTGSNDEEYASGTDENKDSKDQVPPPVQQIMNNPMFIQQNGDGNVVMPNYGTINLTLGGKKRE